MFVSFPKPAEDTSGRAGRLVCSVAARGVPPAQSGPAARPSRGSALQALAGEDRDFWVFMVINVRDALGSPC